MGRAAGGDAPAATGETFKLGQYLPQSGANATYGDSHAVDDLEQVAFAMDMTPLVEDDSLSPMDFIQGSVDRFVGEMRETLRSAGA